MKSVLHLNDDGSYGVPILGTKCSPLKMPMMTAVTSITLMIIVTGSVRSLHLHHRAHSHQPYAASTSRLRSGAVVMSIKVSLRSLQAYVTLNLPACNYITRRSKKASAI